MTLDNNRAVIVSPYRSSARHAVDAGFEVYSVVDPAREPDAHLAEVIRYSTEIHPADLADAPALRRLVRRLAHRVDAAHVLGMGRWEDAHLPVAEVAQAMRRGHNPPEAIRYLDDKAATRRLLRDNGLSEMDSAVFDSPDEVGPLPHPLEAPVIAKPTRLSASRGVMLIRDAEDLAAWRARLAAYRYTGPVIVEEFLRGPEFSVETLTAEGEHHLIGITAKRVASGFVEIGHLHPAPLAEPDRAAIAELVTAFLDAAGYRFGPAHTELVLTERGPRIIESQARFGGDRIPLLVRLATGMDMDAVVYQALTGKPIEPPMADRFGCVSFFRLAPGVLRSVSGLAEIARLPFVGEFEFPFAPGDVLPDVVDTFTRHGHVVVDADSPAEAEARVALVDELLAADIEPVGGTP
jgi:biotin carboxylase